MIKEMLAHTRATSIYGDTPSFTFYKYLLSLRRSVFLHNIRVTSFFQDRFAKPSMFGNEGHSDSVPALDMRWKMDFVSKLGAFFLIFGNEI